MARTISTALQAELDKTVTRIGYLLELNTSPVLRWCNLGEVTWDSVVWVPYDFELSGVGSADDGPSRASLKVQNLDSAAAAALLDADMAALVLDVWQVAPAATGASDVIRLGRYLVDDLEISTDKLELRLLPEGSVDAFSPRKRIDPSNGFNYALAPGVTIAWESEIYVVGDNRG